MNGEARIRNVEKLGGKGNHEETKAMEKVKKQLRSVLIPHKNGLLLDDVSKEYREMVSNVSCFDCPSCFDCEIYLQLLFVTNNL